MLMLMLISCALARSCDGYVRTGGVGWRRRVFRQAGTDHDDYLRYLYVLYTLEGYGLCASKSIIDEID